MQFEGITAQAAYTDRPTYYMRYEDEFHFPKECEIHVLEANLELQVFSLSHDKSEKASYARDCYGLTESEHPSPRSMSVN